MIFFSFFLMGLKNQAFFNSAPHLPIKAPHKDPLVSIVVLCDEFCTRFEKKSRMYNLSGQAEDWDSGRSEILHIAVMGIITQRNGLLG